MVNEKGEIVSRVPIRKSLCAALAAQDEPPTTPISSDVTGEFSSSI